MAENDIQNQTMGGPTISQNKASGHPEVRPCSYEAILHVPLSDILQHGTLCAEDVPIGVLQAGLRGSSWVKLVGWIDMDTERCGKNDELIIIDPLVYSVIQLMTDFSFRVPEHPAGSLPSSSHSRLLPGAICKDGKKRDIRTIHFSQSEDITDITYKQIQTIRKYVHIVFILWSYMIYG